MNRAWTMFLLSGCSLVAMADTCPTGVPAANYSMAAKTAGEIVSVTIVAHVTAPFTVCFDGSTVEAQNVKTGDNTSFDFRALEGQAATGEHAVSVVADGSVYATKLGSAPFTLSSVTSLPLSPANNAFKVRLHGQGFDSDDPRNNNVQINDEPLQLCWSDSECAARNLTTRGEVLAHGQILELTGVDPVVERN